MAIRLLKHHISDLAKNAFFDYLCAEYDFARPFDTLKHPFIDLTKHILRCPEGRS
jgi:hypothetical protein